MELFYLLAITANVLFTGICAYCLSVAVSRSSDSPETDFLKNVSGMTRKFVVIGGSAFVAFAVYAITMTIAVSYA